MDKHKLNIMLEHDYSIGFAIFTLITDEAVSTDKVRETIEEYTANKEPGDYCVYDVMDHIRKRTGGRTESFRADLAMRV